ncbi:MAG: chemotaxis protein CheB [Pelolinea sp.]|nr:chemotaxis protein CheB [Pelolinea sp.]
MINFDIIVLGASLGGLKASQTILSALPARFSTPIVIVQHRKPDSSASRTLTNLLQKSCALPVVEAEDKMTIKRGQVYISPPDYHLLVEEDHFSLSTEAPVNYARPSIDVLFESTAIAFGKHVIGVLLTGANIDGALGLKAIRSCGGLTIVQDPKTADAVEMPFGALEVDAADHIMPLNEIGPFLVNMCCR